MMMFFWRLCHDSCWTATREKEDLSGRHADAKELYRDPNGGVPGPDKVAVCDDQIIDSIFDTMRLV